MGCRIRCIAKNIGVHLVKCRNNSRKYFFSLLCSLRSF
jgi:hypothetical protein